MKPFRERFKDAIARHPGGVAAISETVKATKSTIYNWRSGTSEPTVSEVADLAKALGADPATLAFGEDARPKVRLELRWTAGKVEVEQLDVEPPTPAAPAQQEIEASTEPSPTPLPAKAGRPRGKEAPVNIGRVAAGNALLPEVGSEEEEAAADAQEWVAQVRGDSMEPNVPAGSRILMRRIAGVPKSGAFVLVRLPGDEGLTFKRWGHERTKGGGQRWSLIAQNPRCGWGEGGIRYFGPQDGEPVAIAELVAVEPKASASKVRSQARQ